MIWDEKFIVSPWLGKRFLWLCWETSLPCLFLLLFNPLAAFIVESRFNLGITGITSVHENATAEFIFAVLSLPGFYFHGSGFGLNTEVIIIHNTGNTNQINSRHFVVFEFVADYFKLCMSNSFTRVWVSQNADIY